MCSLQLKQTIEEQPVSKAKSREIMRIMFMSDVRLTGSRPSLGDFGRSKFRVKQHRVVLYFDTNGIWFDRIIASRRDSGMVVVPSLPQRQSDRLDTHDRQITEHEGSYRRIQRTRHTERRRSMMHRMNGVSQLVPGLRTEDSRNHDAMGSRTM